MILPNPANIEVQEYISTDTMCLDISNNLSQEINREDGSTVDYDNLCTICLESIINKKIDLPCSHRYHPYCILKWVTLQQHNNNDTTCPYCKQKYDYEQLVNNIISTKLTTVEDILKKLDCITKYCLNQQVREYRIITLKRNYIKLRSVLSELDIKGVTDPINCQYIYLSITPLAENVLKLIGDAKDREAKMEASAPTNCDVLSTLYQKLVVHRRYFRNCLKNK